MQNAAKRRTTRRRLASMPGRYLGDLAGSRSFLDHMAGPLGECRQLPAGGPMPSGRSPIDYQRSVGRSRISRNKTAWRRPWGLRSNSINPATWSGAPGDAPPVGRDRAACSRWRASDGGRRRLARSAAARARSAVELGGSTTGASSTSSARSTTSSATGVSHRGSSRRSRDCGATRRAGAGGDWTWGGGGESLEVACRDLVWPAWRRAAARRRKSSRSLGMGMTVG